MSILQGKPILLGISGGIAAYKAAELTRLLVKAGAQVRVCMTRGAEAFITPLTLQALSGHPVHTQLLDPEAEAGMGHIELARWADLILIAPASADVMARLAGGHADDLLTTLCLASPSPLAIAPAMNQQMWKNPATQNNKQLLEQRGVMVWGPDQGEQACGDVGPGRMLEPAQLLMYLQGFYQKQSLLAGKTVLLTAGPTREALDPVRFLSNHSSGKMGYAVAAAAQAMGARVILVSGPVGISVPEGVECVAVESAQQMLAGVQRFINQADIFIATAAVADYAPAQAAEHKIKKSADILTISMQKTVDILATIAKENPQVFSVGFAAETQDVLTYARDKLVRKKVQMIAANSVAEGKVFGQDSNALELVWDGGGQSFPEMSKTELAVKLMGVVAERYQAWKAGSE